MPTNKILVELQKIRAGQLIDDKIYQCHSGRHCELKHNICFYKESIVACSSAVPCKDATAHQVVVYKAVS